MNLLTQPRGGAGQPPGEQRFLLQAIDWGTYETFLRALGDRSGVRLTYDRGNLELMSPPPPHEIYKTLLGRLVAMLMEELDIPVKRCGSTTFRSQDLDRGLEPDECFYLRSAPRVRDWARIDLSIDPPPDLAIEVECDVARQTRTSTTVRLTMVQDGSAIDSGGNPLPRRQGRLRVDGSA